MGCGGLEVTAMTVMIVVGFYDCFCVLFSFSLGAALVVI